MVWKLFAVTGLSRIGILFSQIKSSKLGKEESKTPTFPIWIEKCIYVSIIKGNEVHCTDHGSLSNCDQSQDEFP